MSLFINMCINTYISIFWQCIKWWRISTKHILHVFLWRIQQKEEKFACFNLLPKICNDGCRCFL